MKFKIHPMWWGLGMGLLSISWASQSLIPALILGGIVVFVVKMIECIIDNIEL